MNVRIHRCIGVVRAGVSALSKNIKAGVHVYGFSSMDGMDCITKAGRGVACSGAAGVRWCGVRERE